MQENLITQKEAAKLLNISEATLERDRCLNGTHPRFPYIRIGRSIRYERAVLVDIIKAARVGNVAA